MGVLENIDRGYQEQANLAAYWAGKDAQKQHEAHKVMQDLVNLRNQHIAAQQPSGGGGGHHPAPAPAPYVPPPPPPGQDSVNYTPVKIPDTEVVVFLQDQVSADALEKLYFEDVGGTEILAVARHDTVGGEPVATTPIANLENIQLQFNPLNILTSTKAQQLFNQFAINIDTHLYDSSGAVSLSDDEQWLVIQLDDLKADEYVQIQVSGEGDEHWIYDETWYNTGGGTE